MIAVNATVKTSQENIQSIKAAIAAMEKANRAEEGCDDYTFSVELNDHNILRITERWTDIAGPRGPL